MVSMERLLEAVGPVLPSTQLQSMAERHSFDFKRAKTGTLFFLNEEATSEAAPMTDVEQLKLVRQARKISPTDKRIFDLEQELRLHPANQVIPFSLIPRSTSTFLVP